MSGYGTNTCESEIILAICSGDFAYANKLMDGMLPGELTALGNAAFRLESMIDARQRMAAKEARR